MKELLDYIGELAAPLIDNLPLVGVIFLAVIFVIRFGLAALIKHRQRYRNYREKRGLTQPSSWFRVESKVHFEIESALLANKGIREMYAPSGLFIRDLKEKERRWEWAWLSPNARAVRATIKDNRSMGRGKKLDARKQIAEASGHIIVRDLPASHQVVELEPEEIPEGETEKQRQKRERREEQKLRANHFMIVLKLDGHGPEEIRRLEGKIVSQLGLHSLQEIETEDNFSISYAAHMTAPGDPLVKLKKGVEFLKEHATKSLSLIPLAVRVSGAVWALMMHHLLIIGMTGSGKGSPLNGLIRQLAPWADKGLVRMFGIDPKASELRPYEESRLFEELAYENSDALDVIAEVHKVMKHRAKHKRVDVENADLGRSLDATRENPMVVLFIDEFLSLLISFQAMGKDGRAAITLLTEILAQGRSLGVFVVAATQEADKDLLGRMRGNFANIILLKQPSEYFNDFFLGEGARAAGYDSTAIPLSTKANGYAYAGIGYVKEETGKPVKVRFAYSSDQDIADLIKEYPKKGRAIASKPTAEIDPAIYDEDDDGDFGFEEVEAPKHTAPSGGGFGKF